MYARVWGVIYIHAYMHTCIHTYIHAYMHKYIHTYTYKNHIFIQKLGQTVIFGPLLGQHMKPESGNSYSPIVRTQKCTWTRSGPLAHGQVFGPLLGQHILAYSAHTNMHMDKVRAGYQDLCRFRVCGVREWFNGFG